MKALTIMLILISVNLFAQEKATRIPLIGEKAPSFVAESTNGKITFPDDYFNKWKIIFSHPDDFTPVCSTEILELAYLQDEFKKLNAEIIIISTDGINSHMEWKKSLENLNYKQKGPVSIKFPLISDKSIEISKLYGMIHPTYNDVKDVRGVFIIDPENKIRALMFYPNETGRNMDEILRMVKALQNVDKNYVLTPANWTPGADVLLKSPATEKETEKFKLSDDKSKYSYAWYMWFTKQGSRM
ncbi:MAG: peroxiredoxin [Bacteroidetes bacterium HGW-Bacteroidetes-21]|jgi:peroxiredoxin (alkyl hydroperoxide reductase subunit C)|nr:MAG: peroxiredoxin [Bacteroidetes bacterium HGW-Bacteroidetes-21]